jgi:hypothetical protein
MRENMNFVVERVRWQRVELVKAHRVYDREKEEEDEEIEEIEEDKVRSFHSLRKLMQFVKYEAGGYIMLRIPGAKYDDHGIQVTLWDDHLPEGEE